MIDINLIATRRAVRQRSLALMRLAFYSLFGLALIIILMYAWMTVQIRFVSSQIVEAEAVLSAPDIQKNLQRIGFLESEIRGLHPKVRVLKKVHESEDRWMEVLKDIGSNIPADVFVSDISSRAVDRGQQINMSGVAVNQELVGAYMLDIQARDWCGLLQLVQVDSKRQEVTRGAEFELTIPLKEAIGVDLLTKEGDEEKEATTQKAGDSEAGGELS